MKRHLTTIILVASLCSTGRDDHAAPSPVPVSSDEAANAGPFVLWAREHSIGITTPEPGHGFADLQPLKAAIGQARVVALGESAHAMHESLAFRNRLWELLVREMDFTAIAVETGFSEGIHVDDYVQGRSADAFSVSRDVYHWGAPKAFEENHQLVEWMREHNHRAPAGRKIRFYGIDLSGGERRGEFTAARQALDASLAYLERVDSALGQGFRSQLAPFLAKFQDKAYSTLSPNERSSLAATIAELVSVFQRRRIAFLEQTTENDYARAFRQTVVAQYLDAHFRNSPAPDMKDPDFQEAMNIRDSAMADNLQWVLDREGPRGRVLVFAHNGHVSKSGATKEAYPEFYPRKPRTPMGQYFQSFLRDEMMVIGFTFKQRIQGIKVESKSPLAALDPDSLDGQLARVGAPLFLVDLRAAAKAGPVADWLKRATKTRKNDRYIELKPINAFDALLFVETVSAAHEIQPLRSTLK